MFNFIRKFALNDDHSGSSHSSIPVLEGANQISIRSEAGKLNTELQKPGVNLVSYYIVPSSKE